MQYFQQERILKSILVILQLQQQEAAQQEDLMQLTVDILRLIM